MFLPQHFLGTQMGAVAKAREVPRHMCWSLQQPSWPHLFVHPWLNHWCACTWSCTHLVCRMWCPQSAPCCSSSWLLLPPERCGAPGGAATLEASAGALLGAARGCSTAMRSSPLQAGLCYIPALNVSAGCCPIRMQLMRTFAGLQAAWRTQLNSHLASPVVLPASEFNPLPTVVLIGNAVCWNVL